MKITIKEANETKELKYGFFNEEVDFFKVNETDYTEENGEIFTSQEVFNWWENFFKEMTNADIAREKFEETLDDGEELYKFQSLIYDFKDNLENLPGHIMSVIENFK